MKFFQKPKLIGIILVTLMLLTGCSHLPSKDTMFTLKNLREYSVEDFNLSKEVKYFEINYYKASKLNNQLKLMNIMGYPIHFYFDRTAFNALSANEKQKINNALPVIVSNGFFGTYPGAAMHDPDNAITVANVKVLDQHLNVKNIATKREVLTLLGKIDTLAELQLVLWLNNKEPATRYKVENHQYTFISHFNNGTMGEHLGCGSHTYRGVIDEKGNIARYNLIEFKANEPSAPLSGCSDAP